MSSYENFTNSHNSLMNLITGILEKGEINQEDKDNLDREKVNYNASCIEVKNDLQDAQNMILEKKIIEDSSKNSDLTQSDVFNALTENGQLQGFFKDEETGEIYINAEFIQTKGWRVVDDDGNVMLEFDKDNNRLVVSGDIKGATITGSVFENEDDSFKIDSNGNIKGATITGASININNGAYKVSTVGNTKIGGDSAVTTDGYLRALCEITSNGTIFSCSSTDSSVYTRITEGKINVYAGDIITTLGDAGIKVSDGSTATTYGDGFISHNLSIMVDTPILNCTQSVYANEFRGQGNCVMKAPTGSGVYLLTNGASIGDDENTNGVKTIRYFKNTNDDYVFRTNSVNGSCYNGTSSYPWKQVAAKEFKNTSDRTLKENIKYLEGNLPNTRAVSHDKDKLTNEDLYNFVKDSLFLAEYNYKGEKEKKIGFIAQDLIINVDGTDNKVGQLIVNPKSWNEDEGKLTYDVNNYISVLAGALQMAMKKIDILEGKINGNK